MTWSRWISCCTAAGATLFLVGVAFHLLVLVVAPGIPPQFLDVGLFRPWSAWTSTSKAPHPLATGSCSRRPS